MELKIVYLPIEALTPYEKNARKHKAADVEVIKKSIEEFGFNDPIGIWGDKNIIVEGHGRLIAATELGFKEVPCIRLDDLTDEQRKAYALTHNRSAELSEWDIDNLDEELRALNGLFSLEDLGFEDFLKETEPVEVYPQSETVSNPSSATSHHTKRCADIISCAKSTFY